MCCHNSAGGREYILCDSTGRGLLEPCTGFLWILPMCLFLPEDFAPFSFTVINNSLESDLYAGSPSESLRMSTGMVLETPYTEMLPSL